MKFNTDPVQGNIIANDEPEDTIEGDESISEEESEEEIEEYDCEQEQLLENISFTPPLYIQRYHKACEFIEKNSSQISKVVDIGCAEMQFFRYLKQVVCVSNAVLIDIDKNLLTDNIKKVKPIASDYLVPRSKSLDVEVLCGNALSPHKQYIGADIVTMIEIIEHLNVEHLPNLVKTVFEYICPKFIFISTPNSEYNKFFPDFAPGDFRHWDHKFEWNSEQFETWANNIIKEYPSYSVEFTGVGQNHNVYCTQIAIFNKISIVENSPMNFVDEAEVIIKETFPEDTASEEDKLKSYLKSGAYSLLRLLKIKLSLLDATDTLNFLVCPYNQINFINYEDKQDVTFTLIEWNSSSDEIQNLEKNTFYYVINEDSFIFMHDSFTDFMGDYYEIDFLKETFPYKLDFTEVNGKWRLNIKLSVDDSDEEDDDDVLYYHDQCELDDDDDGDQDDFYFSDDELEMF